MAGLKTGGMTYASCGVDIEAGDNLVQRIKKLAKTTHQQGVVGGIGGFGGVFNLKKGGSCLIAGTDGVGTKLKIAQECDKHDTVGIDLVAMCVNDILTQGAKPLFFLDYYACGKLDVNVAESVISGICVGCRQSGCSLLGGETAEMPGMYNSGEYDLAGFAVGSVEESEILPKMSEINVGDVVIGIGSSGIHSNGYSLVRKLVESKGFSLKAKAPFNPSITLGEALLTPTKIYVKSLLPLLEKRYVKAAAHITGGGLTENIPRVLSSLQGVFLDAAKWEIPTVLKWIASEGNLSHSEMLKTFNCGIGMVLIVSAKNRDHVLKILEHSGEKGLEIGAVVSVNEGDPQVIVKDFCLPPPAPSKPKRKIGVLISGSGTNLQALIDHVQNPVNFSAAEIALVISNKDNVEGLARAKRANIPTMVINHKEFKSREDFDMAMNEALKNAGVEIICLAGFMRLLSAKFVQLWRGHLLNIHPSLLPSFKGVNAHEQVLEMGAKITGCTVHFVEPEMDSGAIIEQASLSVNDDDTCETLQERVKLLEHKIYPKALELLARGKIYMGPDGKLKRNN